MDYRFRYADRDHTITLEPRPGGTFVARIGEREYTVQVQRAHHGQITFLVDGRRTHAYTASCDTCQPGQRLRYVALVDRQASAYELIQVTGEAARRGAGAAAGASLDAQMPGQVRQVLAKEGDHVEAGQTLLILEAMKMEMRIAAPQAGRVVRLLVRQGDTVERGEQLVEIQPLE